MSDESAARFKVPGKLDKSVAVVIAHARQKEEILLAEALAASTYEVEEEVDYDNWDGGTYAHAVHFLVPPDYFMLLDLDDLLAVEQLVRNRLNHFVKVRGERIAEVTIEVSEAPATVSAGVLPSREAHADLWGDADFLRLFITHKSEYKERATEIRDACQEMGITCFVAHEDIEPTTEWHPKIVRALHSMDALLALLTPKFHESPWTDQEVGAAVGRQVLIIPVKSGCDPYGLIGKIQAIPGHALTPPALADTVVAACLDRSASTKAQMKIALVARFERAESYDHTRRLMGVLESIDALPGDLLDRLEAAPADNSEIADTFGIKNSLGRLLTRLR
jgi:hypothetical protein